MGAYFSTSLRNSDQFGKAIRMGLMAAALLFLFQTNAAAQGRGNNTQSAQAVLHIRVNVVPTVMLPQAPQASRQSGAVTYNLPVAPQKVSVTDQTRPYRPEGSPESHEEGYLLKTVTVVPL